MGRYHFNQQLHVHHRGREDIHVHVLSCSEQKFYFPLSALATCSRRCVSAGEASWFVYKVVGFEVLSLSCE